ncbi:MAG TPA: DNA polymerase III subunit delta' [Betaproteobacteria bacterium]|jgi:DNA polymerase-3 subunit delta'|nr:DNA polymerase III subunit delta' [Betaproteobacteria bacterium]
MIDILPWQLAPLQRLISRGDTLPHALLIHGRNGVGKLEFAKALAQSLLCEAPEDGMACGTCPACRWFQDGNHPDFREILPASLTNEADVDNAGAGADADADADDKDKKKSREIKIDQIRGVSDFMTLSTHRHGYRVLLIHPAEAMNLAAANALLKTLEEPASRSVILLVSDQLGRLLATIRSRCQRVLIPMPESAVAVAWLTAQGLSNPEAGLAAAGGAPLDAIRFGEADYQAARNAFVAALAEPDFDYVLTAQNLEKSDLPMVLGWLQTWTNDLVLQKMTGKILFHRDRLRSIEKISALLELPRLFRFETELRRTRRLINHPLNARLLLEQLLIAYKQAISSRPNSAPKAGRAG